jgi:hypothetical protein
MSHDPDFGETLVYAVELRLGRGVVFSVDRKTQGGVFDRRQSSSSARVTAGPEHMIRD